MASETASGTASDSAKQTAGKSAKNKPKRLGRGLSSLLSAEAPVQVEAPASAAKPDATPAQTADRPADTERKAPEKSDSSPGLEMIEPSRIVPNKFQPRREFDVQKIAALGESIRDTGLMQPVVVRPRGDAYELVAGERRWRAAKHAGVRAIPAIVRELSDQDSAEWALIENEQREDLNPIERARACRQLHDRFGLSHAEVGRKLGIDRSSVSNLVRLLDLEDPILDLIAVGNLSAGHGKALLAAPAGEGRILLAQRALEKSLSVRDLERLASESGEGGNGSGNRSGGGGGNGARADGPETRPEVADLQRQLESHLGSRVKLRTNQTGSKGRIEIPFDSLEHFDSLMERIGFRLSDD